MKNHHSESIERALSNHYIRVTIRLFLSIPLIFALFILYPANHFKTADHKLYWQKVYYYRLTFEQLQQKVKDAGIFYKIEIKENKITGELKPLNYVHNLSGKSSIPLYLKTFKNLGFVTIESEKGKYTVTCTNMAMVNKDNTNPTEQIVRINLEKLALENGTNHLQKVFEKYIGKELNNTFTNMFSFR